MIILPAIDIIDGNCVRLVKGDYNTAHKVAEDPIKTSLEFKNAGASWIHMVDLDGAKLGKPVNSDVFSSVIKATKLNIELGGGIRNLETIEKYLEVGVKRVILGSAAIKNPLLVKEAVKLYGENIAVGIDAKNGFVSAEGWLDDSDINYIEFAKKMEDLGVKCIIFTDISRDGTLTGPNLEQLTEISLNTSVNIIASGGIKDINDIKNLGKLNLYGAICGKSIYEGTLNLSEAIKVGG